MINFKNTSFDKRFSDNESCLEWIKNQLYPNGIRCQVCNIVTKHHKALNKPYYSCDKCGNHVHPTAGTLFHKSTTPLNIWFKVIGQILHSQKRISAKEIQREFGITYKTAWRMVQKINAVLQENQSENQRNTKNSSIARGIKSSINSINTLKVEKGLSIGNPENPNCVRVSINPSYQIEYTGEIHRKMDRIARLLRLQIILLQHPQGLQLGELANKCSISKRTLYRDLRTLESELNVPIWEENSKRGIVEGHYLPPINFTSEEAIRIFIASRLMQQFSPVYDSNIYTTLMKLSSIVPIPLRRQINHTLDYMEKLPKDERKIDNCDKLIQAWLSQHKAKIICQYWDEQEPIERIIEPYFIEPSIIAGSSYVIAFCHLKKMICTFKIAQIVGSVIIEPDTYEIPDNFNAMDYINAAWGIQTDSGIETVKLHFKAKISKSISALKLHPS